MGREAKYFIMVDEVDIEKKSLVGYEIWRDDPESKTKKSMLQIIMEAANMSTIGQKDKYLFSIPYPKPTAFNEPRRTDA
jgi:hypothetical protein